MSGEGENAVEPLFGTQDTAEGRGPGPASSSSILRAILGTLQLRGREGAGTSVTVHCSLPERAHA